MMISKAYLNKKPRKEKSLREEINKKINGLMDRNQSSTYTINSFINSPDNKIYNFIIDKPKS